MPVVAPSSTLFSPRCVLQDQLFDLASIARHVQPREDGASADVRSCQPLAAAQIGLGILSHFCGPELIDRALAEREAGAERRRKLPPRLTVGALLLMALGRRLGYRSLMVELGDAAGSTNWSPPTASAFAQARQRLGSEVMERLYHLHAQPLAEPDTPGSFWRGRRIVAIDGTTMQLEDVPELQDAFGGQVVAGQRVGPPMLRTVSLVECGTRAQLNAEYDRYDTGEIEMAKRLAPSLRLGMLALADRNFFQTEFWKTCRARGADLLWRIKGNVATKVIETLPDGSYLAQFRYRRHRDKQHPPLIIRVIEYAIEGSDDIYRLATNLLDPQTAPAAELARLYTERWEIELSYREIKAVQLDGKGLRSQTEDGVRQEFWSVHTAYNISRRLCHQAAMMLEKGDPDQISFSLALNRILRSIKKVAGLQVRVLRAAAHFAARALSDPRHLLKRRDRTCPRVVRQRRDRYVNRGTYKGPASVHQDRCPTIRIFGAPDPSGTS